MTQATQTKKATCRFCGGKRTDPFGPSVLKVSV